MKPFPLNLKTPHIPNSPLQNPITVHGTPKGELRVLDYKAIRWAQVSPGDGFYETVRANLPADLQARLAEPSPPSPQHSGIATPAMSFATSSRPGSRSPTPPPRMVSELIVFSEKPYASVASGSDAFWTPPRATPNLSELAGTSGSVDADVAAANKVGPAPKPEVIAFKNGRAVVIKRYFDRNGEPITQAAYKQCIVDVATGGVMLHPNERESFLGSRCRLSRRMIAKGASYLRRQQKNSIRAAHIRA